MNNSRRNTWRVGTVLLAGLFSSLVSSSASAADDGAELLGTGLPSVTAPNALVAGRQLPDDFLDALFEWPAAPAVEALLGARIFQPRGRTEVDINKAITPATVFILQGRSTCTGTLIGNEGEILTCWHCVRGGGEILVRLHPSSGEARLLAARLVRSDPGLDLALLKLPTRPQGLKSMALGDGNDIQVGADVYAVGHPSGLSWSFVKGMVSQVYEKRVWDFDSNRHEAEVIQSQIPLYEGNSGGPLVSDKGLLIGVNASKRNDSQFTFAISVSEVRRFLGTSHLASASTLVRATPDCKRRKLVDGRNLDNTATVTLYDTDCDGKADTAVTVPDDPSRPVLLTRSSGDKGRIDLVRVRHGSGQTTYLSGKKAVLKVDGTGATTTPQPSNP